MINLQTDDLQPDDPKVNPELFILVQKALAPVAQEERENFNPMKRPYSMIRDRLREIRAKVIADYQKAQAASGAEAPEPPLT